MSITDGTFICKDCGEWITGCSLCGQAELIDMRHIRQAELTRNSQAERELWLQERAIKGAANGQSNS